MYQEEGAKVDREGRKEDLERLHFGE